MVPVLPQWLYEWHVSSRLIPFGLALTMSSGVESWSRTVFIGDFEECIDVVVSCTWPEDTMIDPNGEGLQDRGSRGA